MADGVPAWQLHKRLVDVGEPYIFQYGPEDDDRRSLIEPIPDGFKQTMIVEPSRVASAEWMELEDGRFVTVEDDGSVRVEEAVDVPIVIETLADFERWYETPMRRSVEKHQRDLEGSFREMYETAARLWDQYTNGDQMAEVRLDAPNNPYRQVAIGGEINLGEMAGYIGSDEHGGPGLGARDIDRIIRDHHRAGFHAGQRAKDDEMETMRSEMARIFDEGYTAGRMERAKGLANDFYQRSLQAHFSLMSVEQMKSPAKVAEGLEFVRTHLNELMEFAEAIKNQDTKAAAQMARDEP